jgi:hypothetical protein
MPALGDIRTVSGREQTWSTCPRCSGTGIHSYRFSEGNVCDQCRGAGELWLALAAPTVSPCACCAARGCGCDAMEPDSAEKLSERCGCCLDRWCDCLKPAFVIVAPPGGVMLDLTLGKYT